MFPLLGRGVRELEITNCDHLKRLKFSPTMPFAFTEYGFDKLTEREARYLLRAENAHTIRDRVAQARSEAKP